MVAEVKIGEKMLQRLEAAKAAEAILALASTEAEQVAGDYVRLYWQQIADHARSLEEQARGSGSSPGRATRTQVDQYQGRDDPDPDIREAMQIVNEIANSTIANESIPAEGKEFLASVAKKAGAIAETIHRSRRVSEAQWSALKNMREGVSRWSK